MAERGRLRVAAGVLWLWLQICFRELESEGRHQSKWKYSLLQTSENRTRLLIPLLNDSFPMEDLGSVNRKWAVKYLQVQGPGFYRLWGPFKLMTVNFPTSRGDFSEVR